MLQRVQLWNQLLHDLGERLEDRVVVDRGQMVADLHELEIDVDQFVLDSLVDVALDLELVVVGDAVHLVNEHLEDDVLVQFVDALDHVQQRVQRVRVVVLGVDDEHQRTGDAGEDVIAEVLIEEVHLARKVPNTERDERRGGDLVLADAVRGLEEQRFVRRHLVEDHLLDRRLARTPQAHDVEARMLRLRLQEIVGEVRILFSGGLLVVVAELLRKRSAADLVLSRGVGESDGLVIRVIVRGILSIGYYGNS